MRLLCLLALGGITVVGCAVRKPNAVPGGGAPEGKAAAAGQGSATNKSTIIVTPGTVVAGKIALVNVTSRFVVVTFPIGTMPAGQRRLNVYRDGLKVAELQVSGEPLDVNTVADIVAGECLVGDEVREN